MHAKIKKHFQLVDPVLFSVIANIEPFTIHPSDDYFVSLCESIVSQQLSVKAGDTIWKRFTGKFGNPTPQKIFAASGQSVRDLGISWSKVSYLKNLATYATHFNLQELRDMPDEEVIIELTRVKGIGLWTAEMFLMFTLGRHDVFSYGDVGLKNAIKKLYNYNKDPTKKQMEKLAKKWSPYRTYAARILWRSLEL